MKQKGFTLMEVSIALFLMAAITYMLLQSWIAESQRAQSKLAGQQYKLVKEALDDYLALFHDKLLTLSSNCSMISYAADKALSVPAEISSGACKLTLSAVNAGSATVAIRNGLQPTVDELKLLRLIDPTFRNSLMLPTVSVVHVANSSIGSSSLAPPQYAIQISKVCSAVGCGSYQLTGLVFNTQPYAINRSTSLIRGIELLSDALAAAGPDAAISTPALYSGDSELHGWNDLFTLPNPLRKLSDSGSSSGLAGVLAVRSGYGSASMSQFARLDGSRNISGNWNFDGHSVSGIAEVNTTSLMAKSLSTQTVTANSAVVTNQLNTSNISVSNTMTGRTITGNTLTISDRVSSAGVQANYVSTNDLYVNGTTMINSGRFQSILLPYAAEGWGCAPSMGSLAMDGNGTLLVCRGGGWVANN